MFGIDIRPPSSTAAAVELSAIVAMVWVCETDDQTRRFIGAGADCAAATVVPTKAGVVRERWLTMRMIEELSIRAIDSMDEGAKVEEELVGWVRWDVLEP